MKICTYLHLIHLSKAVGIVVPDPLLPFLTEMYIPLYLDGTNQCC